MKRTIIAVSIIAMTACSNSYDYTLTEYDALLNEHKQTKETIHAKNDSLAFEQALARFSESRKIYDGIHKDNPALIFPYPESFVLKDKDGKEVFYTDRYVQSIPDIPDDHKAYAGIVFGMSMSEVKANDRFAEDSWSKYDNLLYTSDKIGNIKYSVVFGFVNDQLYRVQFSERGNSWNVYDVTIQYIENLNYVFSEAYGKSPLDFGIPQKSDIYYGSTHTVSKWLSPSKSIAIYIKKHRDKDLYSMWGEIVDTKLAEESVKETERIQKEADEAKRQSAIKDADLF